MTMLGPFDFRGGHSPGYDFTVLPQGHGYVTRMQNLRIKGGYLTPRWSQTQVNTVPSPFTATVLGLTTWKDIPNSATAIIATTNSKLFISSDLTSYVPETGTTITFTDRTGAIAASSLSGLTTFDSLNSILVGSANSTSSGVPFKVTAYNANGAALGGSPPSADIAKQVNNFMFLSRNLSSSTTQSTIYWSNVNDPETWTGTNVLNFNKNDGEPIMALGSIGTDLYIFKKTSIGRLSTVTITTSGAVTLGPLVTVIRGVGCCGPRALDNLPNGNIVFLSQDGHFYEFDGSTLDDLSRQPFPGHNVFDYGAFTNVGTLGISLLTPDVNVNVKTCRGANEVWISYTSSVYSSGHMTYVYNFEQHTWQGNIDVNADSLATFPIQTTIGTYPIESLEAMIHGSSLSKNIYMSGNSTRNYFNNDDSVQVVVASLVQTTINLIDRNGEPFIPRSICIETSTPSDQTKSRVLDMLVYANFDTYSPSTLVYTSPAGQLPTRTIIPLTWSQDSIGTNIFPSKLTIGIQVNGTGSGTTTSNPDIIRIGSFWLSDEVAR